MKTKLYIANKNYSSWSMRGWMAVKQSGIEFEEIMIPLRTSETKNKISIISPSKKVPCLHHNGLVIWDSLAIAEYVHELNPDAKLLPKDQKIRAIVRSVCAQMHSGFMDLRKEMHMNMKLRIKKIPSEAVKNNIDEILSLWQEIKFEYGKNGDYLFGEFGLADIFYAPVVSRFISYGVDVGKCQDYLEAVLNHELYQEWYQAALKEEIKIKEFDVV